MTLAAQRMARGMGTDTWSKAWGCMGAEAPSIFDGLRGEFHLRGLAQGAGAALAAAFEEVLLAQQRAPPPRRFRLLSLRICGVARRHG